MSQIAKPTVMMRLTKIKFDRVVPPHILAAINVACGRQFSTCPVMGVAVRFHQTGEAYVVNFRMNGATIGSGGGGYIIPGPFMELGDELRAYLMHVVDEAFAIVAPLDGTHE